MKNGSPRLPSRLRNRYRVHTGRPEDVSLAVAHEVLMDRAVLWSFLEGYRESVGADSLHTAASRWSYHLLHPLLKGGITALYATGSPLTFHPDTLHYQRHREAKPGYEWGVRVSLDATVDGPPGGAFRRDALSVLTRDVLEPMLRSLNRLTRLPLRVLVENVEHVLTLFLAGTPREHPDGSFDREGLGTDLRRMQLDGGERGRGAFLTEAMLRSFERSRRVEGWCRTTCCLNYRLAQYCERCPVPRGASPRNRGEG